MNPTAEHLLQFCLAVLLLGNVVLIGLRLLGRGETRQIAPQPLVVKPDESYVLESECDRMRKEQERRIAKIEDALAASATAAAESRKTMYLKMDGLRDSFAADMQRVHSRVDDLQAEVRAVPSTVVRMIKEAREI